MASADLASAAINHLVLLHQITRASVPLMETAHAECLRRGADPVCAGLAGYLLKHIEEERHHDDWTLDDLESAGIARSDVLKVMPAANVAALVGAQYYWILHHHPVAILGYMIMLEFNAPAPETVREMQRRSGLPGTLFRSHLLHAELDPHHQAELFQLVDDLGLSGSQVRLVTESAIHTGSMLADCLAHPEQWGNLAAGRNRS
ncbi:iron-containing redox enzyme family protein [Aestuariivirga sp.]|uniref:iron-containing redox enzyme family protein n=1 Tax=Aestuariivirga sp. TaxID=2650926 RepID=UPI003BAB78DE